MQARVKRYVIVTVFGLLVFGFSMVVSNGSIKFAEGGGEGEKLFQANCISCHSIGGGNGVGPDLKGVAKIRDKEWLNKMIRDPKALVDSGDQTVTKLVDEYGMVMPKVNLSDAEITAIVTYLETQSAQGTGASNDAQSPQGVSKQLTASTFALYGFLGALILFAIMAVVGRGRLRGVRKNI